MLYVIIGLLDRLRMRVLLHRKLGLFLWPPSLAPRLYFPLDSVPTSEREQRVRIAVTTKQANNNNTGQETSKRRSFLL